MENKEIIQVLQELIDNITTLKKPDIKTVKRGEIYFFEGDYYVIYKYNEWIHAVCVGDGRPFSDGEDARDAKGLQVDKFFYPYGEHVEYVGEGMAELLHHIIN